MEGEKAVFSRRRGNDPAVNLMPKMKTHRGAAKRFKLTGQGKIKKNRAYKSHFLEKKSAKRKRDLRHAELVSPADVKRIKRMLAE